MRAHFRQQVGKRRIRLRAQRRGIEGKKRIGSKAVRCGGFAIHRGAILWQPVHRGDAVIVAINQLQMADRLIFPRIFRALQNIVPFARAVDFAEMWHVEQGKDILALKPHFDRSDSRRRQAQRLIAPAVFLRRPDQLANAAIGAHILADGGSTARQRNGGKQDE